jgi:hypothetical protein
LLEYKLLKLAVHVLPRAIPDMNPHGCRRNAIDDYVPGICNRKAALAAPSCGHANSRVFEDQIERVFYALSDQPSASQVFVSNVSKGVNVGLQPPAAPTQAAWRRFRAWAASIMERVWRRTT